MKYSEIIADKIIAAGFSVGWVSAVDSQGRTIWIVEAQGYAKHFVERADKKLTAFVELESAISSVSRRFGNSREYSTNFAPITALTAFTERRQFALTAQNYAVRGSEIVRKS